MKEGRFFRIPERPADIEAVRRSAVSLGPESRPSWLDEADVGYYRLAATQSSGDLTDGERSHLLSEVGELRATGLVVERDHADPEQWHVYVQSTAEYETWSIGICAGPSPLTLAPAPGVTNPVLTRDDVSDEPAVFVADPFMLFRNGRWFMFFELLNWRANKGEIGLATSEDGRDWRYEQRVLVEPFHLSYPHVFEHDGECYMVPESRQAGAVRLYRAADFPCEWSLVATLLETDQLVDSTLFRTEDRWWMFAGDCSSGRHDRLRLFRAENLTGPWREHAASPVVDGDDRVARPAGRVVRCGGRWLRFAQNCHGAYGIDVRAFAITDLDESMYRETPAAAEPVLRPEGWVSGGMHHVDSCRLADGSWLACVDGWTRTED